MYSIFNFDLIQHTLKPVCYNLTMKVIRTLKITSDEFYDYLESQFINEVKKSTQRDIKPKDIKKGFKYSKDPEVEAKRIDIEVLDYTRGMSYSSKAKSYTDHTIVRYDTEQTNDGLKITFEQELSSFDQQKKGIYKNLTEALYLSRMGVSLYDMQTAIEKIREKKQ